MTGPVWVPQSDMPVSLVGVDGIEWDLLHPLSPVWIVGGFDGLHMPTITTQASQNARTPGRRRRGRTVEPRTVTATLHIGDQQPPYRTGQDWRNLEDTFWLSVPIAGPGKDAPTVRLKVGDRYLPCRLESSEPGNTDRDPAMRGSQRYNVELVSDGAFWLGPEQTYPYVYDPASEQNYYGATAGLGPPFYISASSIFDMATVDNPGQEPAYLRWVITGPCSITVGVGADLIPIPFQIAAGEQVIIDTDPDVATIVDGAGVNLWPRMEYARVDFGPVPPGMSLPVTIQVFQARAGMSAVATLQPLYHRAWGRA